MYGMSRGRRSHKHGTWEPGETQALRSPVWVLFPRFAVPRPLHVPCHAPRKEGPPSTDGRLDALAMCLPQGLGVRRSVFTRAGCGDVSSITILNAISMRYHAVDSL